MPDPSRPFFALYIVWHPMFSAGAIIAEKLRGHFRRKHFENITGGTGLSVIFRSSPSPSGSGAPFPIDLAEAEVTAVVVLVDKSLAADAAWVTYIRQIAEQAETQGLGKRVFPVAIEREGLSVGLEEQALIWDTWDGLTSERCQRLNSELTYEFCRMLRHYLEHLRRPTERFDTLEGYLKKVQIFLSHSKHDQDGNRIANLIRDALHQGHGLASFFDVHDIPAGLRFPKVLIQQVRVSAVVAIHTDSFSSREWCRREIIEAKRWNVPLVIANCISVLDERGFPYMGNVPIVRLDPYAPNRIPAVIGHLLDEVLKDFLWHCRVLLAHSFPTTGVVFLPRPPELISLASLPPPTELPEPTIVYPDPPLGAEEQELFERVAPHVRIRSMTEWLAEEAA